MTSRILSVAWGIFLATALIASAGPVPAPALHKQIQQTYNFQPHLLQGQALQAKSNILDQFWTQAKSDPAVSVPALRQELADFSNPPFFLYDSSKTQMKLIEHMWHKATSFDFYCPDGFCAALPNVKLMPKATVSIDWRKLRS